MVEEYHFGTMVEWTGGQKCMIVTVEPPVFVQMTLSDDEADWPLGDTELSHYPFSDNNWTLIDG